MNPAIKYLYHAYIDSSSRWHPFLAVFYLTYRCDFRCPYCSNGASKPFYRLSSDILPADEVLQVLGRIRQACDYLVITGGEPMKHPEFGTVMERIKALRFRDVALNTNGYDADQFLPEIARSADTLIFSLDTLDEKKANAWFGTGTSAFEKILTNIRLAENHRGRKYRIVISSVATTNNLPDLYEVYDFAQRSGFLFAVCPELQGVRAPQELVESSAYRDFYSFLISEKKKGKLIHGSPLYLRFMKDFSKFSCRPFTMLVVDPLGQVFYPCLEIGHVAGNILESADVHALREAAMRQFGPQPACGVQCHSACALGFSLILEQPASLLQEALCMLKNKVNLGISSRASSIRSGRLL